MKSNQQTLLNYGIWSVIYSWHFKLTIYLISGSTSLQGFKDLNCQTQRGERKNNYQASVIKLTQIEFGI